MKIAAPATRRSRRMVPRRTTRRLLLWGAILYLVPLVVLAAFQRQLIFNTRHSRQTTEAMRASGGGLPPGAHLVPLRTEPGDSIVALYGHALRADGRPDPDYARRPTLLFFYGKGSSLAGGRHLFQSFRLLDVNVLMPDYVGFGQSGGQESEANCDATAEAAYRYLQTQADVNQKAIVIAGFSLGSGVAVDLAARETTAHQPVAGLALFAAYTSLADEAHQQYPIYPTFLLRLLLRYPFASEQKMPRVTCPTLIVHSRADRLIPFWMSERLAAASGGQVTRLVVARGGHADYFGAGGRPVFAALGRFIEKITPLHETQQEPQQHTAPNRVRAARIVPQAPHPGHALP